MRKIASYNDYRTDFKSARDYIADYVWGEDAYDQLQIDNATMRYNAAITAHLTIDLGLPIVFDGFDFKIDRHYDLPKYISMFKRNIKEVIDLIDVDAIFGY